MTVYIQTNDFKGGETVNFEGDLKEWCFIFPPPARWAFTLDATWAVQFNVPQAPAHFYRVLQRLFLGIRWKRL
mgnify:CR=1 FL=1